MSSESTHRVAVLLLILALPVAAQDAASQIKVEIQRLQQSLKDRPFSDPDLPDVNSMVGGELKAANDALNAGRLYLGLERLAGAEDLLQGARVVADKKAETVKGGLPAYEEEWKKVGTSLNAQGREVVTRDWRSAPAAQRALSETAQGRAVPLLEGGRGFATSMQPKDGLFYIGQAQGEAAFARFCGSLRLPRQGSPSLRRSLLRELQALQEKTNAAFVPPRSIDLHSRFIALNSTLKLAQELDAAMSYSGALYQYLEAVRHWGMLDVAAPDAAAQSKLKEAVAAMGKKIDASASDDSIAKLFIERAASQVAHADGSAPSADEWKSAQVILDQVLPAYFDAQKKTVARISVTSGKTVEITLVRWPYT